MGSMVATDAIEDGKTVALVISEINGPFEVKEVHLKGMRPDEIVVRMVATGVCHTDIATATVRNVKVFFRGAPYSYLIGSETSIITRGTWP